MSRLLQWLFGVLALLGVPKLVMTCAGRRARVLMYHGVCTGSSPDAPGGGHRRHVPRLDFDRQMRWIARHARPIPLDELVGRLERGEQIPRRSVAVTFDDGYLNNREQAWPVLRQHDVPATIYVTTGFVEGRALWTDRLDAALSRIDGSFRLPAGSGEERIAFDTGEERRVAARELRARGKELSGDPRERWVRAITTRAGSDLNDLPPDQLPQDSRPLTPSMIRDLAERGVSIGSHTVDHSILTHCPDDLLRRELNHSRETLEHWTGTRIDHFAYPNGRRSDFDERTEDAVREAGYRSAVLNVKGSVRQGDSPFRIPRIGVEEGTTFAEFLADLSGIRPAVLRLRDRLTGRPGAAG